MSFHIGQKVVCVDAADPEHRVSLHSEWLREGRVYTVRQCFPWGGIWGVLLEEIVSDTCGFVGKEYGFLARRFRPVAERKTDTGFAILEEIRRRETVPAHPKQPALSSTIRTEP